jgi:hypothetical protein
MVRTALSRLGRTWPATLLVIFVIGWLVNDLFQAAVFHRIYWFSYVFKGGWDYLGDDPIDFWMTAVLYFFALLVAFLMLAILAFPPKTLATMLGGKWDKDDKGNSLK